MTARWRLALVGVAGIAAGSAYVRYGASAVDCDASPRARDLCRYDEAVAMPPSDPAAVQARVRGIEDPIIRSAAVQMWVARHPLADPQAGLLLCDLLDTTEAGFCRRRVTAPHLRERPPPNPSR